MTRESRHRSLRFRAVTAVVLAACALGMTTVEYFGVGGKHETEKERRNAEAGIATVVDTVLARYAVRRDDVRIWRATVGDAPGERWEQRVTVPPGFPGIEVNHEMSLLLAPFDAHVVATERTKEESVTMHIVRGGRTVRSVIFVTGSPDEQGRDRNPHP